MLKKVTATRYLTPLREGGPPPGLVEADAHGTYVMELSTGPASAGRTAFFSTSVARARRDGSRVRS